MVARKVLADTPPPNLCCFQRLDKRGGSSLGVAVPCQSGGVDPLCLEKVLEKRLGPARICRWLPLVLAPTGQDVVLSLGGPDCERPPDTTTGWVHRTNNENDLGFGKLEKGTAETNEAKLITRGPAAQSTISRSREPTTIGCRLGSACRSGPRHPLVILRSIGEGQLDLGLSRRETTTRGRRNSNPGRNLCLGLDRSRCVFEFRIMIAICC
ncbi:hypothetical protein B0T14DRAFT_253080 [Immersiella caudata]|uniref:Uncharacterized protein n=1 Tax=Immersiella caudata TaxID=314043 RepID=A0AA39WK53_9PEZI|nr:hypothetical protein B0T14DRAFT_253080 [Immersiella caudata]